MSVVAFIPVRGGSKSIPLKNIKPLCGKPLVCWVIEALEQCDSIDRVIVATDSNQIEEVVIRNNYKKTIIYHRLAQNATDSASTESVMMEYLDRQELDSNDIFMLVQATSPTTTSNHFTDAIKQYVDNGYDSMLSCVRTKRFFWSEDGKSLNYEYMHRPRRQDFRGTMMENGAFYINRVGNILKYGNRLCGHIGIYEMPVYTATEIDEEEDWLYLEQLIQRKNLI